MATIRLVVGLNQALDRTVIGHAQEMLMERFSVDEERAFSLARVWA